MVPVNPVTDSRYVNLYFAIFFQSYTYLVKLKHFGISSPPSFGKKSWWNTGLAEHKTNLCPLSKSKVIIGNKKTTIITLRDENK